MPIAFFPRPAVVANRVVSRAIRIPARSVRPAARPLINVLRTRLDTDQFERRTNSREVNAALPLAKPPTVRTFVLPARLDTDQFERRTISRDINFAPFPLPAPRVVLRNLLPSQRTVAVVDPVRVSPRTFIVATAPTPLDAPRVRIVFHRTRVDTDAVERRTVSRDANPALLLAKPPTVKVVLHRQRLDTDAFERRTVSRQVLPARPLAKPPVVAIKLNHTRLDTDQFQKLVARRVTIVPATPPVEAPVTKLARPVWLVAPVIADPDRWRNRGLIISVPRPPLARVSGFSGGGVPVPAPVERFRNRGTITRALPLPLPKPTVVSGGGLDVILPLVGDGGLALSITLVQSAPRLLPAARSMWRVPRPNTEILHSSIHVRCFRVPARPTLPAPSLFIDSPSRPSTFPIILTATGKGTWAWDGDGSATVQTIAPTIQRGFVIGFDETIGRPKQTKGTPP